MTELDRVGNSDNFNFRGGGEFHRICKSARSAPKEREKLMECLNSDGSASYLLIILVEKSMPFAMTLK